MNGAVQITSRSAGSRKDWGQAIVLQLLLTAVLYGNFPFGGKELDALDMGSSDWQTGKSSMRKIRAGRLTSGAETLSRAFWRGVASSARSAAPILWRN